MPSPHIKRVDKAYSIVNKGRRIHFVDTRNGHDKILTFDPESFTGWMSLLYYQGTVFEMGVIRWIMIGTTTLGFATALIVYQLSPSTSRYDKPTPLTELVDFLMIFLSFMTGLFINGAFIRWQEILSAFFAVAEVTKTLYGEMIVHGCPQESAYDVRRWGLLSLWIAARETPEKWDPPDWAQDVEYMLQEGLTTQDEINQLFSKAGKKAPLPWAWNVMKLRQLSEQGLAPAKQTPAMVRMMDHCHQALVGLSNVDSLSLFQVPYSYMHMLAIIIHFFNIINAIRCGIDLGYDIAEYKTKDTWFDPMIAQTFWVNVFYMLLGPLMYQAFLAISADIMIPFGSGTCDIPVRFLVDQFSHELDDIYEFFRNPASGTPFQDVKTPS